MYRTVTVNSILGMAWALLVAVPYFLAMSRLVWAPVYSGYLRYYYYLHHIYTTGRDGREGEFI